ncbi:hypothetical protein C0991_009495, partial [Blastosporella zonata]
KAATRQTTLSRKAMVSNQSEESQHSSIPQQFDSQSLDELEEREQTYEPPRQIYELTKLNSGPSDVTIVIRQLRDLHDPVASVVRAGEVKLDRDLTLDTSKLDPSKPDATYYGRTSTDMCSAININGSTIARPSDLEYFLRDVPGIALPVLLFM